MGRQRALEAIHLRETSRIPKWIGVPRHAQFLDKLTGIDPYEHPKEASLRAIELLDLDIADYFESISRSPVAGSETKSVKVGTHAAFYDIGTDGGDGTTLWKTHPVQRTHTVEGVLGFDVERHMPHATVDEFEAEIRARWAVVQEHRRTLGERAWPQDPVDWYNTVFMWGITTFGWEAFLEAAALQPARYSLLLERFTDITRRYFSAAARLDGLVMVQAHDDLCMTRGPVFNPRWYREYVFPLYPKVLQPMKRRGVKVIYRGDGNIDDFVDDLAAAGFDGFIVRSETNLAYIAERYGASKVIAGNISTAILTWGGKKEIYEEVNRCARQAGKCPGYFFRVAGEIPGNVPTDNIFFLFDALEKYGRR